MTRLAPALLLLLLLFVACEQRPVARDDYDNDPHARSPRRDSAWQDVRRDVRTARLLARGQVPPGNVRVSWTYLDLQEFQRMGLGFGGGYSDGKVGVVAGGPDFHRNGLHVGVAGKRFAARIDAGSGRTRTAQRTEQFTLVVDGGTASIHIGQVTPVERAVYYGPGGAAYTVDLVATGASMIVSPKIVDPERGLVRVRIAPELSFLKPGGAVELTRIHTDVVVQRGQSIVIGALPSSRSTVARSLFRFRAGSHTREQVVLLTVDF